MITFKAKPADRDKLYTCLRTPYEITTDEKGSKYLNIDICRNFKAGFAGFMRGYLVRVNDRFASWSGTRTAKSPGIYQPPSYGAKQQFTDPDDNGKPLTASSILTLQQLIGCLLYYT